MNEAAARASVSRRIYDRPMIRALVRARLPILTVALTYVASMIIGASMVHTGSQFALERTDRMYVRSQTQDPSAIAFQEGRPYKAFAIEFGRDIYRAAWTTMQGLTVFLPYVNGAQNGWYRGIMSVDRNHASRLTNPFEAAYFLVFQLVQVISFSLASGAGIQLTVALFLRRPEYRDRKFGIPVQAVRDLLRVFLFVLPLLLFSAWWKYFSG